VAPKHDLLPTGLTEMLVMSLLVVRAVPRFLGISVHRLRSALPQTMGL